MCTYNSALKSAKRFLSGHKPDRALRELSEAIAKCPSCNRHDIGYMLYYVGIALNKMGHSNSAIRFWIASYRIHKNRFAKRMLERYANAYGLKKEEYNELEDKKAFFSIQISRYLEKKGTGKFSTQAEVDMIMDLLEDTWKILRGSGILKDKKIEEKSGIFRRVNIVFPFMVFTKLLGDTIINVNFPNGTKIKEEDRCSCGSGLPHCICCGRSPSLEEIATGIF
jgi:hypothetical protein